MFAFEIVTWQRRVICLSDSRDAVSHEFEYRWSFYIILPFQNILKHIFWSNINNNFKNSETVESILTIVYLNLSTSISTEACATLVKICVAGT